MEIREYRTEDETGWVRCRVLSFLETAYFDNVLREKETYENPSIELVAIDDGQVVGMLDIEYETKEKTVCTSGAKLGGMIWHIAVHPDYQRRSIGTLLLKKAERLAKERQLNYLEAWTRDDEWVNKWYKKSGFYQVDSYLHVFLDGEGEMKGNIHVDVPEFFPIQAFGHYTGKDQETIKQKFTRVHECRCYKKEI